ncbi:MAG: hypothetical protein GY856_52070, partial [bacterium]|nr:hypothetical protein [bacterium]
MNDWFNEGVDQIVQDVTDFVDYAREHPIEVSAALGKQVKATAKHAWQEIKTHPVEAAMLAVGAMIVAGSAIAVVASGGALLPVIAAGLATGAVSGAAGQAIEDVATGQFSGWGAYAKQAAIGAAIGGVTGVIGAGASVLGLPSIVTGLVSGATAGVFSQALTNAWEGRSWHEGLGQA